jgi:hypothetical protein
MQKTTQFSFGLDKWCSRYQCNLLATFLFFHPSLCLVVIDAPLQIINATTHIIDSPNVLIGSGLKFILHLLQ